MGQTENTSYFDFIAEIVKACETLFLEQEPNQSIFQTHVSFGPCPLLLAKHRILPHTKTGNVVVYIYKYFGVYRK
jgi:hypothetical protein